MDISNGPVKKRRCTDVLFCLLFLLHLGLFFFLAVMGIDGEDFLRLTAGQDYQVPSFPLCYFALLSPGSDFSCHHPLSPMPLPRLGLLMPPPPFSHAPSQTRIAHATTPFLPCPFPDSDCSCHHPLSPMPLPRLGLLMPPPPFSHAPSQTRIAHATTPFLPCPFPDSDCSCHHPLSPMPLPRLGLLMPPPPFSHGPSQTRIAHATTPFLPWPFPDSDCSCHHPLSPMPLPRLGLLMSLGKLLRRQQNGYG